MRTQGEIQSACIVEVDKLLSIPDIAEWYRPIAEWQDASARVLTDDERSQVLEYWPDSGTGKWCRAFMKWFHTLPK